MRIPARGIVVENGWTRIPDINTVEHTGIEVGFTNMLMQGNVRIECMEIAKGCTKVSTHTQREVPTKGQHAILVGDAEIRYYVEL